MEFYSKEQGFLEEFLALREMELYTNQDFIGWNILEDLSKFTNNSNCFQDFSLPIYNISAPFGNELSPPTFSSDYSTNTNVNSQTLPYPASTSTSQPQHYYNSFSQAQLLHDEDLGNGFPNSDIRAPCKVETLPELPVGTIGHETHKIMRKTKIKKLNGQPSKNLMAERRRRKRLNDRLSMLRSIVPKISKMDRTSILGDTIDYVKELIQSINKLQEEMNLGEDKFGLFGIFKNIAKPEEILITNSPKFEVEKEKFGDRIEICCGAKAGLLLSTMTTLEGLGIDIEQCVISCFNDFAMQASCSQDLKQSAVLDSEDIKHALFRNAGYGGRCL